MAPSQLQEFITRRAQTLRAPREMGETPVLLTSAASAALCALDRRALPPGDHGAGQTEIHPQARIRTLGQV